MLVHDFCRTDAKAVRESTPLTEVLKVMTAYPMGGVCVVDDDNNVVGLLFAGSSNTTVFNRIQNVVDALEIEEIYARARTVEAG